MKRFQNLPVLSLNYLPGVVTLVFGMLALHSTVSIIDARHTKSEIHQSYISDIIAVERSFYAFEDKFKETLIPDQAGKYLNKDLRTELELIGASFSDLQQGYIKSFPQYDEKQKLVFYNIQNDLLNLSNALILLNKSIITEEEAVESVDDLHESIEELQETVFMSYRDFVTSPQHDKREQWLYWSVLVMGLSGFVLTVLNADKIRNVRKLNEERKQNLIVLENRLMALEKARDGIVILDNDDKVVYINKSLRTMMDIDELPEESYLNKPWVNIFIEEYAEIIEEEILPLLKTDGYWWGEFPLYKQDDSHILTEMSLTSLPDGGTIGTIQDISEKQKAESEKKAIEDQFIQAQKMEAIGRLAGGIAHDFNNILAAMNGYAEFLIDDLDVASEQHKFADNILQAGLQARSLVDQMLTFSRRSDSAIERFDLVTSVDDVVSMLSATLPKTIEVNNRSTLSRAPIIGSTTQISQLIMNLCVNARDAINDDHGEINIEIMQIDTEDKKLEDKVQDILPDADKAPIVKIEELSDKTTELTLGHIAKGRSYIKLQIDDSGCGMSKLIMEHIFEPFFTTKPVDKGTGLGLSTVHGIVVNHQAMMVVTSTVGKGTKFEFYFPFSDVLSSQSSASINLDDDYEDEESKEQYSILLVEDNETVRFMVEKSLERLGMIVDVANNGAEGVKKIKANPDQYELILTDYNMPKMTGLEMAQEICKTLPDLPFIVLSGYSEEKISKAIVDHPSIKRTLKKPAPKEVLEVTIHEVIQEARSSKNKEKKSKRA